MRFVLLIAMLASTLLAQAPKAQKCGFANPRPSLDRVNSILSRDVPTLDEAYLSPGGRFKIHFTRSGTNAVLGSESLGTPQFVMEAGLAADSVYSLMIDELGFLPPLPDGQIDGPELDIYIKEWGGSFYGMTYFENSAPSPTYLVIDNDFAENAYATKGLAALRVTIAHEFFHMVQLRYAYPFEPVSSNAYWYEISATWMEERCYPEVNDYHAYVANNFKQTTFPNLNDDSSWLIYSYGHALFGQVLDQEYGSREGKHIMLDIWENLSGKEATDNLEQVLSSNPWNSSLTAALGRYALYNVFTGLRSIPDMYYHDAPQLAEINTQVYSIPNDIPADTVFSLAPFRTSYCEFHPSQEGKLYISGQNLSGKQHLYLTKHGPTQLSSNEGAIGNKTWLPSGFLEADDYLIIPMVNGNRDTSRVLSLFFEGSNLELANTIQSMWPNPHEPQSSLLHLNLMLDSQGMIKFKVYNLLGQVVHQESRNIASGIHTIDMALPQALSSGVYFIQMLAGGSAHTRKFTVLK